MAHINLAGVGVALVTPFRNDKSIDFEALGRLLEYQIKNSIDYIVVLGTTAETPTLDADEKRRVREYVAQRVAGRVPLVLGVGGNNTMAVVNEPCHHRPVGFQRGAVGGSVLQQTVAGRHLSALCRDSAEIAAAGDIV